ncbi:hypothetical protein [Algibacter agarivorans]
MKETIDTNIINSFLLLKILAHHRIDEYLLREKNHINKSTTEAYYKHTMPMLYI